MASCNRRTTPDFDNLANTHEEEKIATGKFGSAINLTIAGKCGIVNVGVFPVKIRKFKLSS